jgi:uncharacterized membrane protein YeaQ/YmgE (transglycosylase-associated protein family)
MTFVGGFALWVVLGIIGAVAARALYRTDGTEAWLTFTFGLFGAVIGGMLGVSPYIHHAPTPLRLGAILGALMGGLLFTFLYHFIARKAT